MAMQKPVYLDYAATTPVDDAVAEKMIQCLCREGNFGNPASSMHTFGWQAEEAVENARRQVAQLVKANPREIIWTSGATEANNLALQGVAHFYRHKGDHLITVRTEHKAVLDTMAFLQKSAGFKVTYLQVDSRGRVDMQQLEEAITADTLLISVMHVNNETGVLQDIAAIGELARRHGVFFHVDAVQSVGKFPLDLSILPVDLMSFSSHKLYGPKGIGALYVRRKPRVRLQALIHGGGHESGMRSGTLPTHQIVGMGEAFALAELELAQTAPTLAARKAKLQRGLQQQLPEAVLHGCSEDTAPHILNMGFPGVEGEALLMALTGLAVSNGSACNSASMQPSHVLTAMGVNAELAHSSIRMSLGKYTSEDEIEFSIQHIVEQVKRLRELSPLWSVSGS